MAAGPVGAVAAGLVARFTAIGLAPRLLKRLSHPCREGCGWRKGSLANSLLTRFLMAVELGFVGDGDVFVQSNEQAGWEPPPLFLHFRGEVSCGGEGTLG